ncbi:MAG: DUF1499 domain-containing protein [Pseudomonadota bacterium]
MIKRILLAIPLLIAGAVIVCLAVLFLTGPEQVWATLFGDPDLGPTRFEELVLPDRPNHYLVCPPPLCAKAQAAQSSGTYAADRATMIDTLTDAARALPNVRMINGPEPDDVRFIQRTRLMQFPDTVSIRVVEAAPGESQLAIYSRSQIGRSDLGVNKRRIEAFLADVDARLAVRPAAAADTN